MQGGTGCARGLVIRDEQEDERGREREGEGAGERGRGREREREGQSDPPLSLLSPPWRTLGPDFCAAISTHG